MKKLYRSRSDVVIAGVCSGLADYIGLDQIVVRLVFLLLSFAALGGFWLYVILWVIMPVQPEENNGIVEVKVKPKPENTIEVEGSKITARKKKESSK